MFKTIIVAAALLAPVSAFAGSTWEGEFFGVGAYDGTFDATFKGGKIKGDVTGLFVGQSFEPAALPFKGTYSVNKNGRMKGNIPVAGAFTGWRGGGHMDATFKNGGGFNATKTGKTGKGGK